MRLALTLDGRRSEWETTKSSLRQMPGPAGFVVSMPPHRVHHREPTKVLTDLFDKCPRRSTARHSGETIAT